MQIELAAGERKGVGVEVGEVSGGLQLDFAIVRSSHGGNNGMCSCSNGLDVAGRETSW